MFEAKFPEGESLRQTKERMHSVLDKLVRLPNCGVVRIDYHNSGYRFDGIVP